MLWKYSHNKPLNPDRKRRGFLRIRYAHCYKKSLRRFRPRLECQTGSLGVIALRHSVCLIIISRGSK